MWSQPVSLGMMVGIVDGVVDGSEVGTVDGSDVGSVVGVLEPAQRTDCQGR